MSALGHKILRLFIAGLLLAAPLSHAVTWDYSIPSSPAATVPLYISNDAGVAASLTVTRNINSTGFLSGTINACSGTGCPTLGTKRNFLEAIGFAVFGEKFLTSSTEIIHAVSAGICPTSTWTGNWILAKWPSSGFDMTSTTFPAYGDFSWNPATSTVTLSAYNLANGSQLVAAYTSPASCSNGTITLTGSSLDAQGSMKVSAVGGGIYETVNKKLFVQPQFSIPSVSSLYGSYGALITDNAADQTVSKAVFTVLNDGGTDAADGVTNAINPNVSQGDRHYITITAINSPEPGMFTGTAKYDLMGGTDYTTPRNIVCSVYQGKVTSLYCISQNYDDATKPQTFIMTSNAQKPTPGSVDNYAFGSGISVVSQSVSAAPMGGMVILNDGRVAVAGNRSSPDKPMAIRFDIFGKMDTSFGVNGEALATVSSSSGSNLIRAVTQDSAGKLIVVGSATNTNTDWLVARYSLTGALDTTFAGGVGYLQATFNANAEQAEAVAVDAAGKIYVFGHTNQGTHDDFGIMRFTTAGVIDSTFNSTGKRNISFTGFVREIPKAMIVDSNYRVLMAGSTRGSNGDVNAQFALARLLSTGADDSTFGTGGRVVYSYTTLTDQVAALAIQPADSKILALGHGTNASTIRHFALARFSVAGVADSGSFGSGTAKISVTISGSNTSEGRAIALQIDSKILAVGVAKTTSSSQWMPAMARINSNGTLDTAFGTGGTLLITTVPGNTATLSVLGVGIQAADDKIVFGGGFFDSNSGYVSPYVIRVWP